MILVIEKLMLYVGHMFFGQVSGSRTQQSFLIYWTGYGKQTVTLSWFPPPQVWDGKRSGFWWLEWVERDKAFFLIFCWTSRQADTNPSCIPSGKTGYEVSNLLANLSATMRNVLNTFLIVFVLLSSM